MLTKIVLAVAALMFMTPGLGLGADVLPRAQRPEDVGFSTERLARLTKITQEHVEAGRLPGAVILIARQGKIAYFESFGHRDRDRGLAMSRRALSHLLATPGLGFGLGFQVRREAGIAGIAGSVGEYGWAGNAGTLFWIDPVEKLIALYMIQVGDAERIALRNQFRSLVEQAIVK